jgi:hypothetical protein
MAELYVNVDRPDEPRIHTANCWVKKKYYPSHKKIEDGHWRKCRTVAEGKKIAKEAGCRHEAKPCKFCKPR